MKMKIKFERMLCSHMINQKKPFEENVQATKDDIRKCLKFCWNMTYGAHGEHRDHRTGGIKKRSKEEIFQDIFIGKMGEVAFYRWCKNRGKSEISEIDFDCFDLGKWDSSDFILTKKNNNKLKVAVKTTKDFGNLLLLEVKDWQVIKTETKHEAIYIPNKDKDCRGFYDYIVLCRVKTNLQINPQSLTEDSLEVMAKSLEVKLQVVGMIENKELAEIINSGKYKIYQGDKLNQSTTMDADNYYIQSGAFVLYE